MIKAIVKDVESGAIPAYNRSFNDTFLYKIYKGKKILTLRPFKGDFSNKIFPPWDLIMSDAIDNPRPTLDLESPLLLSTL